MSFLNITDPIKCDPMVKEFIKTKESIEAQNLATLTGEINTQSELTEFIKPVVESEKRFSKNITTDSVS